MTLILQVINALFRGVEIRLSELTRKITTAQNTAYTANRKAKAAQTAADNAQTAADNAKTAADNAKTAADNAMTKATNAYANASISVKLANVTIPKSMVSELVTLLKELQTGERGKVSYDGKMFSKVFYICGNVQAEFSYTIDKTTYNEYMLLNSTTGHDAQGFLYWDYSLTGTDIKTFFIKLGNKVTTSYIEVIRLS